MDEEFKRLFGKRVSNKLPLILSTLDPFRDQLNGVVVESTYNWYWLIDGLMDAGYQRLSTLGIDEIKEFFRGKIQEEENKNNLKYLSEAI